MADFGGHRNGRGGGNKENKKTKNLTKVVFEDKDNFTTIRH